MSHGLNKKNRQNSVETVNTSKPADDRSQGGNKSNSLPSHLTSNSLPSRLTPDDTPISSHHSIVSSCNHNSSNHHHNSSNSSNRHHSSSSSSSTSSSNHHHQHHNITKRTTPSKKGLEEFLSTRTPRDRSHPSASGQLDSWFDGDNFLLLASGNNSGSNGSSSATCVGFEELESSYCARGLLEPLEDNDSALGDNTARIVVPAPLQPQLRRNRADATVYSRRGTLAKLLSGKEKRRKKIPDAKQELHPSRNIPNCAQYTQRVKKKRPNTTVFSQFHSNNSSNGNGSGNSGNSSSNGNNNSNGSNHVNNSGNGNVNHAISNSNSNTAIAMHQDNLLVNSERHSGAIVTVQQQQQQQQQDIHDDNDDELTTGGSRRLTVHGRRISAIYISDSMDKDLHFKLSPSRSVMRKPGPLCFLPDELLLELMSWLEPEDLATICTICKRWYIFAETDLLWEAIAKYYYPVETKQALLDLKCIEMSAQQGNHHQRSSSHSSTALPLTPHQRAKKKYLLAVSGKRSNSPNLSQYKKTSTASDNKAPSLDHQLLTSRFFKKVFATEYAKDLHLLKTGVWRNTSWRPKKSIWSKEDYTYVHDSISGSGLRNSGTPIKIVVVGDGAVGKTSLLCRYANGEFPEEYVPTIFENFSTTVVYQNHTYSVSLWDTAGPEDFDKLRPLSYIGADIFLLCFSLVNNHSLQNSMERWLAELSKHAPNVPILLCGTKMDFRVSRTYLQSAQQKNPNIQPITFEKGVEMAKRIGAVSYVETSSLTGRGVADAFNEVMRYGVLFSLAQKQPKNSCECM